MSGNETRLLLIAVSNDVDRKIDSDKFCRYFIRNRCRFGVERFEN